MPMLLIVAGDRGKARIFGLERETDEMRELADLVNPAVRLHEHELSGDRQGRGLSRFHTSRVALGKSHPHKRLSSMRFARQVAEAAHTLYTQRDCPRIFLLADPEFLGLMRPQLAAQGLGPLVQVIPKSMARSAPAEIRAQLPEHPWKRTLDGVGV